MRRVVIHLGQIVLLMNTSAKLEPWPETALSSVHVRLRLVYWHDRCGCLLRTRSAF